MVIIRIQRPNIRSWFTALKDCEPPETSITASVLPCVGRTEPTLSGIQSSGSPPATVQRPDCLRSRILRSDTSNRQNRTRGDALSLFAQHCNDARNRTDEPQ